MRITHRGAGITIDSAFPDPGPGPNSALMKIFSFILAALAAFSLFPATAQKEESAKKKEAPKVPAPEPAVKTVDGGAVEKKFIGKWAPNPEAMMKEIQKGLADDPSAALALPFIEAAMKNMAVSVQKGEVTIHAMGDKQTATYKITKVDKATNKLTMQITDDEGVGEGTATIEEKKDGSKTLTLEKDGDKFILDDITESEFEKRKNAAGQAPLFPGLE